VAEWKPELVVDETLAGALIAAQFPELVGARVERIGVGWDNTVFAVAGHWAFRFPRRAVAVAGVEREIAVLPRIAPLLDVAIPSPRFVGAPSGAFPWPFFGAPLIGGSEATGAFDRDARRRLAPRLGGVLRQLHAIPPPPGLPHDPNGRTDPSRRVPLSERRLAQLEAAGLRARVPALREVIAEAHELPQSARRTLVHGDLHWRHVLVDSARPDALAGIIDWGDVCTGDPAMDLAISWMLFEPAERQEFGDAYGPMDPDQVARARLVALFLAATLALYGAAEGQPALRDEALAALDRVAAGEAGEG
jgi:aminoglycoside phosphotransferase (APT) family kinase protein